MIEQSCGSFQVLAAFLRRALRAAAALGCFLSSCGLAGAAPANSPWWQHAVIYEIYPRSFQDSDGDGVGDLNGITRRLDYLRQLGVDAIWIAPFYPSPQVDFGYDISDYRSIDPQFGSLADFDRLLKEAQVRHIRVILDMVLNHTSNAHPWFIAASRGREDPKHDWYVWNDGRKEEGGQRAPANNWISLFGGSAWEWVPPVEQYYYHEFYRQQPDLNWRNPAVETAMFDAMRFWLDRGVAGFRLDAITSMFEDPLLRDEPVRPGVNLQGDPNVTREYTDNLPEVHAVMKRLRRMVSAYPGDRLLIGETYVAKTSDLYPWYGGADHDELNLPMDLLVGFINKLDVAQFRQRMDEAQRELPGSTPLLVFDNHDNVRSWDRYGDGVHNVAIARALATVLLLSRGSALIYQGQEYGQVTSPPSRREDVRDPIGITGWPREKGRDGERTPMQWNAAAQSGFSANPHTWLPLAADYKARNVAVAEKDPLSLLNWYRRLIALRSSERCLLAGDQRMLDRSGAEILAFVRAGPGCPSVVVAINMSPRRQRLDLGVVSGKPADSFGTLASDPQTKSLRRELQLGPFGVWIGTETVK